MTVLKVEAETEEGTLEGFSYDEKVSVRIVGDEEGIADQVGLDRWFNSARITVDPHREEVSCVVSVGDPRGGFAFVVRRTPAGTLLIHMPHPGEGMPHMRTKELHEGTLEVVGDRGEAVTFEDEEHVNREPGWRDGWEEMEDGYSETDSADPFSILFDAGAWWVTEKPGLKRSSADEVTKLKGENFEDADEAAERAEQLNDEALEEEED